MKHKLFSSVMAVALAALAFGTASPSAKADLPPDMSWVKYSGNPVVTPATCGVASPFDPAVIVNSPNNYTMWFTSVGLTKIYKASTTDGGKTWTCDNANTPVLTVGGAGTWDADRATNPAVILDGSTYKMWYTGRAADKIEAIGYATSSDGISWTKAGKVLERGLPNAWDGSLIRGPSVVKAGTTYHMWYEGTALWPYFKIGHATSSDGIAWTKDAANPVLSTTANAWDAIEVFSPSVVWTGGTFEMFYSGNTGGAWLTGHASSADGVIWIKDANAILSVDAAGWDNSDSNDYAAGVLDGTTWKLFYSGDGYQIGLATLEASPQLTFRQLASSVSVGGTVDVYIDLTAVTDLYGYQFEVNYDATKLSATAAAFVDTFYNTSGGSIPDTYNHVCASGVCKFAVSMIGTGNPAVSGSGPLAKITFAGVAPGLVKLTFSDSILTNVDALPKTHTTTTGWINVNGSATVSGIVSLQGRSPWPIDAGKVTVFDYYGYVLPTTVNFDPISGAWSAVVPFGESDKFTIVASHGLYLSNQSAILTFVNGGTYPQPNTKLWGGDANNDGVIELNDLVCVGGAFGGGPAACGTGNTDITADGKTNILDLVLVGGNYDKTSPQPWQ